MHLWEIQALPLVKTATSRIYCRTAASWRGPRALALGRKRIFRLRVLIWLRPTFADKGVYVGTPNRDTIQHRFEAAVPSPSRSAFMALHRSCIGLLSRMNCSAARNSRYTASMYSGA